MSEAVLAEIARIEAELQPQRDALYEEWQRIVKRMKEQDKDIAALNRVIKAMGEPPWDWLDEVGDDDERVPTPTPEPEHE